LPRLKRFSAEALCRLLKERGFVEVRRKGSHIMLQKRHEEGTTTVPVPNHAEIRVGTLRSIIRQSGLPRELFED
jgi:predicted RNA binding protein YcfA (HicA-like mRNA interferase family)